ncbi:hypothetical protein [Oleispirillum naphthae]|uniref:hypothetical protein n=1 Tax=Oleispirillum naphthae TaxID=2838853 RepID=UPI00308249FB
MMVASEDRRLWRDCGLDGVRGVEDLDEAVEAALGGCAVAAADAPERLAALFGLSAAALERRTGVPVAPEVAAARHGLIAAALAQCRAAAEAPQEGAGLRHALAVCAALQHETLGETQASEAALARREAAEPAPELPARALRRALPCGERIALAAVRALAAAETAADLDLRLACADLPLPDALPLPAADAADAAAATARAVLGALIDILALADRGGETVPPATADRGCVAAAARALAARGAFPFAAGAAAQRLAAQGGALHDGVLAGAADAAGRAAWRALAARPEFRVAAPLVLAPAHIAWRIGGALETGRLAAPVRSALRRGGAARAEAVRGLRAASAVLAALACLADAGLITGRLPEDPAARAAFAADGRSADSIGRGQAARRFDRGTAFGALLGLAADTATLLAYRRGVTPAVSGTVPLDWLLAPPADDAPLDLAAAAAICALPLLDRRVVRGLGGVVRALVLPQGEAALPGTLPGPLAAPLPEAWTRLFGRLWAETAGLSAAAGPRVNLWGEPVGRPDGGFSAWRSPAHDAAGGLSACGRLLRDLGQPVAMPPRGAAQGEAAYRRHAAAAGAAFRSEVEAILEGGHALSPAFAAGGDPELQRLILRRLAAQAADAARRTLPPAAGEGLLRLA